LAITDTELNVIAALAIMGLNDPDERIENPCGDRHA
jgi:hypothetical protein